MSKKPSNTSGLLDPLPVILLDENLSSSDIADELRRWDSDWQIELHQKHFPNPSTPDTEILEYCGKRNWILVSVDDRMRRVPDNRKAAETHRARVFCFPRCFPSGAEYRAALTAGRHRILRLARKMPPPNFARITREGTVGYFERDQLPSDATSRERTKAKYPKAALAAAEAVR
jgi:hypothetical protein